MGLEDWIRFVKKMIKKGDILGKTNYTTAIWK